ncbi:O-antigen ligase family protein [Ramlibacter sp. AN1015]|uniref:O-antigen ligase family protein n=1 Tax=Ramlibacter sp. AN1015 TaxID=3133428 RepID=UPI0030C50579
MTSIPYASVRRAAPTDGTGRGVAALLAAFTVAVFWSTALTNILAAAISILAIIRWVQYRPAFLLRHPLNLACLGFLGWVVLRDVAAGAALQEIASSINHLRVIGFVVLWSPLFLLERNAGVVAGALVCSLAAYACAALALLAWYGQLPYPSSPFDASLPRGLHEAVHALRTRAPDITGPIMLAAIFGALQWALDHPARRRQLVAFAALATAALFLASLRRSSHLGFILCALVFLLINRHRLSAGRARMALVAAAVAFPVLMWGPAGDGLQRAAHGGLEFLHATPEVRMQRSTSESERLQFWSVASGIVREHPVFGSSMARYFDEHIAMAKSLPDEFPRHGNPHNEYLYVLGAVGPLGLLLFLAIPLAAWRATARHPERRKLLALYLAAALPNMLVNSFTIDMIPGHFHALALLAIVFPGAATEKVRPA